jgi:hypothetical protein
MPDSAGTHMQQAIKIVTEGGCIKTLRSIPDIRRIVNIFVGSSPSLLTIAVHNRDYDMVVALTDLGARPDIPGDLVRTPIMSALAHRTPSDAIIRHFLSLPDLDWNSKCLHSGRTPFEEIWQQIELLPDKVAAAIIRKTHNVRNIIRHDYHCNLMAKTVENKMYYTTQALIDAGLQLEASKFHARCPLNYAIRNNDDRMVRMLLLAGAKIQSIHQEDIITSLTNTHDTKIIDTLLEIYLDATLIAKPPFIISELVMKEPHRFANVLRHSDYTQQELTDYVSSRRNNAHLLQLYNRNLPVVTLFAQKHITPEHDPAELAKRVYTFPIGRASIEIAHDLILFGHNPAQFTPTPDIQPFLTAASRMWSPKTHIRLFSARFRRHIQSIVLACSLALYDVVPYELLLVILSFTSRTWQTEFVETIVPSRRHIYATHPVHRKWRSDMHFDDTIVQREH